VTQDTYKEVKEILKKIEVLDNFLEKAKKEHKESVETS